MRRCCRSCWRAGERAAPVSSEQPAKAGVVWLPRCLQIAHVSLHSVLGSPSWPAAAAAAPPPLPPSRRSAGAAQLSCNDRHCLLLAALLLVPLRSLSRL